MMTVSETERLRRAADKGRSASFCAPGQPLILLGTARSFSDLFSGINEEQKTLAISQQQPCNDDNFGSKLRVSQGSRRTQSCRVQGSRSHYIQKRPPISGSRDSGAEVETRTEITFATKEASPIPTGTEIEKNRDGEASTSSLTIKKVGSCGRLSNLAPERDADSPISLKRSASARRPQPSPNYSPTVARIGRPSGTSSVKGRPVSRKGATPTSGSTKRSSSAGTGAGYLDVKTTGSSEALDTDAYVQRNFSSSNKGIVNRGDSFRRRRSRSNSVQPPNEVSLGSQVNIPPQLGEVSSASASPDISNMSGSPGEVSEPERYRIVMLGATGVGKTALLHQFRTSECINAYDYSSSGDEDNMPISIALNNIESEIVFANITTPNQLQEELQKPSPPSGWLLVYSIIDKSSFQRTTEDFAKLHSASSLKGRAIILVGNKCELVRSRAVATDDARDLACSYGAKFMEISVGMNHRCDELLVGILHQLRLKEDAYSSDRAPSEEKEKTPWTRNRSLMRASMKAKRLVNRIMGKSDSKHKMCEDFLN